MQENENNHTDDVRSIISNSLSDSVREEFRIWLKKGIYKELHKRKLLTDEQLNFLLNRR